MHNPLGQSTKQNYKTGHPQPKTKIKRLANDLNFKFLNY